MPNPGCEPSPRIACRTTAVRSRGRCSAAGSLRWLLAPGARPAKPVELRWCSRRLLCISRSRAPRRTVALARFARRRAVGRADTRAEPVAAWCVPGPGSRQADRVVGAGVPSIALGSRGRPAPVSNPVGAGKTRAVRPAAQTAQSNLIALPARIAGDAGRPWAVLRGLAFGISGPRPCMKPPSRAGRARCAATAPPACGPRWPA